MPRIHITDTRVKNALKGAKAAGETVRAVIIEGDQIKLVLRDDETEETGEGIGVVNWSKK